MTVAQHDQFRDALRLPRCATFECRFLQVNAATRQDAKALGSSDSRNERQLDAFSVKAADRSLETCLRLVASFLVPKRNLDQNGRFPQKWPKLLATLFRRVSFVSRFLLPVSGPVHTPDEQTMFTPV